MDRIKGYKESKENKQKMIYVRVDESMLNRLWEIRIKTGISTSELIREAIRRLFDHFDNGGNIIRL